MPGISDQPWRWKDWNLIPATQEKKGERRGGEGGLTSNNELSHEDSKGWGDLAKGDQLFSLGQGSGFQF